MSRAILACLFWLCEALDHPGGCWLLSGWFGQMILRRVYPITRA